MAPVISKVNALIGEGSALMIDTGQRFDEPMSDQFWRELGLVAPEVKLDSGGMTRSRCLGHLTAELGRVFATFAPSAVLVQGDTNTTAAGALAANAEGIPVVHVEAGLRSRDRAMPEECNRVIADHLADLCCAATPDNLANLAAEGIPDSRVVLTGNTIVEALDSQLPSKHDRMLVLATHRLRPDGYILATIHRPENTDGPANLRGIIEALAGLTSHSPVIFPMNPRTRQAVIKAGCEDLLDRINIVEPLGSREFLTLAAHAAVLISDSGSLAEEVSVLKRPLVDVRRSTERAEAMNAGFSRMAAPHQIDSTVAEILSGHRELLARLAETPSPYGDGSAASRIVRATKQLIEQRKE